MNYGSIERIIEAALLRSFKECIEGLPPMDRVIFTLYLEGYMAEEISEELGGTCSVKKITRTIARVKSQIRSHYSEATPHRV